jgi:hypothetical protein
MKQLAFTLREGMGYPVRNGKYADSGGEKTKSEPCTGNYSRYRVSKGIACQPVSPSDSISFSISLNLA